MKKILTFLSLVIVALCFAACSSNSPEAVVEKYYSCMQNQKYEEALDIMYFKKEMTPEQKEQLAALMKEKVSKQADQKQGVKDIKVEPVELSEDGKKGRTTALITFGDGTTKTEKAKVINIDGKWMIDSGK